jgi:hypothetical protein
MTLLSWLGFLKPGSKRPRAAGKPAGFCPRLEALEDRFCPAGTFLRTGGTLLVLGSQQADRINIIDQGNGRIRAQSSGRFPASFRGIDKVVVRARGGNDLVSAKFVGGLNTKPADLQVDLGQGNNVFGLGAENSYKRWPIVLTGGPDNDQVAITLGAVQGTVSVKARLGRGDDTFACANGKVAKGGFVEIEALGEQGSDAFRVLVGSEQKPDGARGAIDGTVKFHIDGGSDDDTAAFALKQRTVNGEMDWDVKMGEGQDTSLIDLSGVVVNGRMEGRSDLGGGANRSSLNFTNVMMNGAWSWGESAGAGGDQASLNFAHVMVSGRMASRFDLGDGPNTFSWGCSDLDVRGSLDATVRGGNGVDQVSCPLEGVRISDNASVNVGVETGGNKDALNFAMTVDPAREARLAVKLDAGADDDTVAGAIHYSRPVLSEVPPGLADGGPGTDVFRGTRTFRPVNFEQVIPTDQFIPVEQFLPVSFAPIIPTGQ